MGTRLTNIKNMSPRARMMIFVTLIVLFFSGVYAASKFTSNSDNGGIPAKVEVAKPKVGASKAGQVSRSIEVQRAIDKDLKESQQKARKSGEAFIDPFSQLSAVDGNNNNQNNENQRKPARIVAPQRLANFSRKPQQTAINKDQQKEINNIIKRKGAAINQLLSSLQDDTGGQAITVVSQSIPLTSTPVANNGTGGAGDSSKTDGENILDTTASITPGRIYPAVLEIGVNTDQISPVVATIQGGPLHGARVVGAPRLIGGETGFIRDGKALIEFSSISWNGNFAPIKAVALDAETSRTALADDVDDHTLYRYTTLIGSFLLGGFGEALKDSGRQVVTAGDGVVVTATDDKDDGRLLKESLGNVGKGLEPIARAEFARPPTVRVFPGGVIGILFIEPVQATWIPIDVEAATF